VTLVWFGILLLFVKKIRKGKVGSQILSVFSLHIYTLVLFNFALSLIFIRSKL